MNFQNRLFNDFQSRNTIGKLDLKRMVYSQSSIIIDMTERLLRGGSSNFFINYFIN